MTFLKKIENKDIEKARVKFIRAGGLVQADIIEESTNTKKNEWKQVLLRVRLDALEEIDQLVIDRMGMTRTGWILEAIHEKIKRSKNE